VPGGHAADELDPVPGGHVADELDPTPGGHAAASPPNPDVVDSEPRGHAAAIVSDVEDEAAPMKQSRSAGDTMATTHS
jgi:hypothetical protein